ncbi:hypothetical protein HK100_008851 [Physocladia obscura]|uniref:Choline/ethanolaminephosphotransferase n=1 Tax=Physocladia obscura TaxID=109957 RepID=A0AAD5T9Y6_9FUNG|nr:hypothetical protein HK100_008851 [Physocladia obscura]
MFLDGLRNPNLITLTGFMCVIANVLLLLAYAPDLRGEIPSWCYISFAFGMFAYQSLDAIDGKQARRTGTSSPLGELFDHGCDALNTGLATFLACKALNIEQSWIQVFAILSSVGNFYLSTWEEYFTGVLYLSEFSGPIEGVWSLILVFFVSAAYGPKVWSNTIADVVPESLSGISLFQVQINFAIIAFGFVVILFNIFSSFNNVRAAIASNPASAERAAKFHPLGGLIPFAVTVPLTLVFPVLFSETIIFSSGIVPYTLFLTFIYGNQVGSIIVAHISKRPFPIQAMVAPVATIVTIGVVIVTVYGFMTVQIMWALAALSAICVME